MTTITRALKFAADYGFTHILASDGTTTPITPELKSKRRASFGFVGGYGWIIHLPTARGYYELVSICNGYQARYNPLTNTFVVSHDEIGAGLAEFGTLLEFVEYAKRG